nr:Mariner Mos1 transposase [Hymenolepis microstoma]
MIEKKGYWVPHELKPRRGVKRRLFACEQLLERRTRKPHVAKVVEKKHIEKLKREILPHPPYSPDVAPSVNFHLAHLAQFHTAWVTSTSARMKK